MAEKIITNPEICDDWWAVSNMNEFTRITDAYLTTKGELVVSIEISAIEPIQRDAGVRPYDKERMLNILKGFLQLSEIPPIAVRKKSQSETHRFVVHDGFHRYYASIAAGFCKIPCVVVS